MNSDANLAPSLPEKTAPPHLLRHPLADDLDHILHHTAEHWESLRGQRLFLTGGTGFFGRWLLESFVRANEQLNLQASAWVLSRHPAVFQQRCPRLAARKSLYFLKGNAVSFPFPQGEFSHIIHAATEPDSAANPRDPLEHFEANVQATRHVLEFARHCGARRLLFTSSGAVYGRQPPTLEQVAEDYPGAPATVDAASAYGQSKRVSEFLCAAYARKHPELAVIVARPFAFVGPFLKLDANFAIGNFIRDALRGGPIRVTGDGTPFRSYLYAADLAVWLWTLLLRGRGGEAYNVGSDRAVALGQLARLVAELAAPGAEVRIAREPDPYALPPRYVPAIAKARAELGLQIEVDLPEAIRRTVRWHRELAS